MSNIIQFSKETNMKDFLEDYHTISPFNIPPYPINYSCWDSSPFHEYFSTLSKTESSTLGIIMTCGWINDQKEKDCNTCKCKDLCMIFLKTIVEECNKENDKTM